LTTVRTLPREPQYPLAFFKTLFLRAFAATALFAFGIVV